MLVKSPEPHNKYMMGRDSNPDNSSQAPVLTSKTRGGGQRIKKKDLNVDKREKSSISRLLHVCSLQLRLQGFQSFPSFLSAIGIFPFCCPRIPTQLSCVFSYWLRLEFTFANISSSLFEAADSEDRAHVWKRIPPGRAWARILPQEHTFLLFAQLYLLLLMVEKGGSKDTWF